MLNDAKEPVFWTTWRLHMTMPSVLAQGERFFLRLTAFAPDGMPSAAFGREIIFVESPGVEGLPKSARLDPAGGGHLAIDGLTAVGPQRACVMALPEGCPEKILSNPAWVMRDPPWRIYWGDLHVHTRYSNCNASACKDPEFCYAYAREASHLDFAAAADHLRGIASDPKRWPHLQELVRTYDRPGLFVPFLAFESSHKTGFGGDINAYFPGSDAPYFWLDRKDMKGTNPEVTLRQLWDFLDASGRQYTTVPHHTGRAGKYRSFADPVYDRERERLFEIYSWWGSSEGRSGRYPVADGRSQAPSYFADAMKAGCRYGVIASGDDHMTIPGGEGVVCLPGGPRRMSNYVHHGLAAVRAKELTRESLWSSLVSRNRYATTFSRVPLDFCVADVAMGTEADVSAGSALRTRRRIRIRALHMGKPPMQAVLVRNGSDLARLPITADSPEAVFEDLEAVAVRDAKFHPGPFVAYYARLETREETQWSSPVWLDLA